MPGTINRQKQLNRSGEHVPDMSKARGARPPQITRPSGSGVPREWGNQAEPAENQEDNTNDFFMNRSGLILLRN